MNCCSCGKSISSTKFAICISVDGDFVCNSKCRDNYERQKNIFFNEILPDDEKYDKWLKGEL